MYVKRITNTPQRAAFQLFIEHAASHVKISTKPNKIEIAQATENNLDKMRTSFSHQRKIKRHY